MKKNQKGFTLVELLVVVAIIVVLAGVLLLAINPAALLAKGRDARRLEDIEALNKALALSLADGEITLVNNNFSNNYNTWSIGRLDYGNYVKISHAGNFQTLYAHLLNSGGLLNIYPGKQVRRGEQIGFLGNTGYSSGPHLHFEIRYNGDPKNPLPYLP